MITCLNCYKYFNAIALDILLENFRPGAMEKLGLSYAQLATTNPKLIYCSLKGFLSGPYSHRTALDEVTQMMGGLAYMTGLPGKPMRAGSSVIDITGGMFGVIGVLAALEERHRTQKGKNVTCSLYETTAFMVGQHMAQEAVTGVAPPPMTVRKSAWAIYDIFECANQEQVFIGVVSDSQWRIFCEAFDLVEFTLIQPFGSALNLNIHFHMLFLEGAISEKTWGGTTFTRIKAPSHSDMVKLVHTISQRIAQYLEKVGLVERDMENSFLNLPVDDDDSLLQLQGASVSYRIAMGPQQGQKVFTLQTLPASNEGEYGQVANTSGFSLHAGVFANTDEPEKLERLCRYISRPAISERRLSMTDHGKVRYELKTPYRDGTTHVFFNPIDFIGKLAALIPPPRLNLTRFYGIFAPNSNLRAQVTASQRGKNSPKLTNKEDSQTDKPYHARSMSWAQRLKRVFNIDITECEKCEKHNVSIIACIIDIHVVQKILAHLDKKYSTSTTTLLPPLRAPPDEQHANDFNIQRDFNFGA